MGGVHMASAVVAIRKTPAAMATTATCESACMLLCISILTPISQSDRGLDPGTDVCALQRVVDSVSCCRCALRRRGCLRAFW